LVQLKSFQIDCARAILTLLLIVTPRGQYACAVEPPITAAAFSTDNTRVLVGSQAGVRILSWPELEELGRLATQLTNVHDIKCSFNKRQVLIAGGKPGESGVVELWDLHSKTLKNSFELHQDLVYKVDWSSDGASFCTASADGSCKIVEAQSGKSLVSFSGHSQAVLSAMFVNRAQVLSMGVDQTIRLWDATNGRLIRELDNHIRPVWDATIRPKEAGGRLEVASVGEDKTVRLWQPEIGRLVRFAKIISMPRTAHWSADGAKLYVGCDDGIIRVIGYDSMQVEGEFAGGVARITQLLVHNDDQSMLVCGEKGCRRVFDQINE
jgi:WD40 repeat protein